MAAPIRVLCADDHRLVREGLALIIEKQQDMQVIGLAADGGEAIDLFRRHRPDVTLMDLQMGTMPGVEAIAAIRREDASARIIVITMYVGDEDIHRAMSAGATTYLYKDTISEDLIRIIREVNAGRTPTMSPDLRARLDERVSRPRLTPREVQVLELISQGMRDKQIAAALGVSNETVYAHVKSVLAKLEVNDRTAAIRAGVRRGIIHLL